MAGLFCTESIAEPSFYLPNSYFMSKIIYHFHNQNLEKKPEAMMINEQILRW